MSSRFLPNENRYSRDSSPRRPLDRHPSAQFNDVSSFGQGRDLPREPPKGPKALTEGTRGGFGPRGRGGFAGRGDGRDRDFRDLRDEGFGKGRGRGQDWGRFDAWDRRVSPVGRDRSRSPLARDFREGRDTRDFAPRDDPRRESGPPEPYTFRGRGGFRGRGRGDFRPRDDWRARPTYSDGRETLATRSQSRDQDWEGANRDDRDRDFEPTKRDDDFRREREDQDDRFRKEAPPLRPDSRNSTGGIQTPVTSRSGSAASMRLGHVDRQIQNARDARELFPDQRSRAQVLNLEPRMSNIDRDTGRGDNRPRSAGNDRFERRTASPPPQAPPVPAFGSIPQRLAAVSQVSPTKSEHPREQSSPQIHPSRLSLMEHPAYTPSAPKAQTFNAPTAPKAQQAAERRFSRESGERPRSFDEDASKFARDPVRNIQRRFSNSQNENAPPADRPGFAASSTFDSAQPSVRKAVEEQGRNGNAPSAGGSSSMLRPPLGSLTNQDSHVKIPTGPRAERGGPPIRQPGLSMRGGMSRGPSMMQRPGRGAATWNWVNPALPKHTPRGPSIMNTVPTKRDSIGEDKGRHGIPRAESVESEIAKWRQKNVSSTAMTGRAMNERDLSSPRSILQSSSKPLTEEGSKTQDMLSERAGHEDKGDEESDEPGADDDLVDLGEEDFKEAENKFEREMKALEARRPATPRSNPELLDLLEEIDALAIALEEKAKAGGQDPQPAPLPAPLGLPSPKEDDGEAIDVKMEAASPLAKIRSPTPPIESLPFLGQGPPTPFSDIEDLNDDPNHKEAVGEAIREHLANNIRIVAAQMDEEKRKFERGFRKWKENVETQEAKRRTEDEIAISPMPEELPMVPPPVPLVGRRGKINSELDMQEVLRLSEETAAKEDRARREREPVYVPPETFNYDREAEVPAMLSQTVAASYMFTDTNNLVKRNAVLQALKFMPMQDDFTPDEHETFLYNYMLYPKRFGTISEAIKDRDYQDCVRHYYLTKLSVKYKDQEAAFARTRKGKKLAQSARNQIRPRGAGLISGFDGVGDFSPQAVALTEKGRPKRSAAPTFGSVAEAEAANAPTATPIRRGAGSREVNGNISAEKTSAKRTRTVPNKEKAGRKGKTPLLAAAPGPSPHKSAPSIASGLSADMAMENEQQLSEIEGAQALAGLGNPAFAPPMYEQGPPQSWPVEHPNVSHTESVHRQQQPSLDPLPPYQQIPINTTSSYWSVPEQQDFLNYVRHYGTNWHEIAATMKTKTHTMIKNHYNRKIREGDEGKQLETDAMRADEMIQNGSDMGPLPQPTPQNDKRRGAYQREAQRPLAPSVDKQEVESSPRLQAIKTAPAARFKQDLPRFTTHPTSDASLQQSSNQLLSQGMKSIESRPTINYSKPTQQQVMGGHLGTFNPEERHRAIAGMRSEDLNRESEQRELQARQRQLLEQQGRELMQQYQDRESYEHHRQRLSQPQNEVPPHSYQQHASNLMPNTVHPGMTGQQQSSGPQPVSAPLPDIDVKIDDKAQRFLDAQRQQQQQQRVLEQVNQHRLLQQQSQQRQPQIETSSSMRRFGSVNFGNIQSQNKSPASATMPPMSPPNENLRPSSVPVTASAQLPPAGLPKKSSIMDLLNNDAPEPTPRKRASDQQHSAPTPPPQPPGYQPLHPSISRRETPTDPLMHLQQRRTPSYSQPPQPTQQIVPPPPQREHPRNWAAAAQQLQQRLYVDDRSQQGQQQQQQGISPHKHPQTGYAPPTTRPSSFQTIQQQQQRSSHAPTPPPFTQPHSRNSSFASVHGQQLSSQPAEPNLRPSPYASHNPSSQQRAVDQHQQQHQLAIQQRLESQQREAILIQQQQQHQQQQAQQQHQHAQQLREQNYRMGMVQQEQHQGMAMARRGSSGVLDVERERYRREMEERKRERQIEREREIEREIEGGWFPGNFGRGGERR